MSTGTDELVQEVCPLIAAHGWSYYFTPATAELAKTLGLDFGGMYFMGRGGVLGDVEWQVVHSAFGYFNPDVVRDAWNTGKAKVQPRTAARAYTECCQEHGRQKLSQVKGLEAFCEAAEAVNDAAEVAGLALYAAARAEPLAADLPARSLQLVSVLREFRGSAHLTAIVASGVPAKTAHYVKRPDAMALFGWAPDDMPVVSDDERQRLARAEILTDQIVSPAYSVLDAAGRSGLVEGMREIAAALSH
ncbi:MAG: SCO6745 family protein [Acidimicrobiales bacterium]